MSKVTANQSLIAAIEAHTLSNGSVTRQAIIHDHVLTKQHELPGLRRALSAICKAGCWDVIVEADSCLPEMQTDDDLLYFLARARRELGSFQDAVQSYTKLITREPKPVFMHELALCHQALGQHERAARNWAALVAIEPQSSRWLLYYSRACIELGQPDKAEAAFTNAASSYSEVAEIHFRHGRFNVSLGEFNKATDAFLRAVGLKSDQQYKYVQQLLESARHVFNEMVLESVLIVAEPHLKDKQHPELVLGYLKILDRIPGFERAQQIFGLIEDVWQNNTRVLAALALSLFRAGRLQWSQDVLVRLRTNDPTDRNGLYWLAGMMSQRSKSNEAVELLLDNPPDDADDPVYSAKIGHILAWSGDTSDACFWLEKAIRLDANNPIPVADLCYVNERLGKFERAFELLEQAHRLSVENAPKRTFGLGEPNQKSLLGKLGYAAMMQRQPDRSKSYFKQYFQDLEFSAHYPIKNWDGELLNDKIVLAIAEFGIGDELRLVSVYDRLADACRTVSVTCDERLEGLLSRSFPRIKFLPVNREFFRLKRARSDVRQLPVNARMFQLTTDDVIENGEAVDYWLNLPKFYNWQMLSKPDLSVARSQETLEVDPQRRSQIADCIQRSAGSGPIIGLSWRGAVGSYNRDQHYFDIEQFEPLFELPGLRFAVINYVVDDAEIGYLRDRLKDRFIEFAELDLKDDFEGVAALCSLVDYAVCVSTSVLELAAAVGAPTVYLARAPYITHRFRMIGDVDTDGSYADCTWPTMRILPKKYRQ